MGRLEEFGRQLAFVHHDAKQARDVVEAADSLAEKTSSTVAGFALRLERLEQSKATLRRNNALLRRLRYPDRLKAPRFRGLRYVPAVNPSTSEVLTDNNA